MTDSAIIDDTVLEQPAVRSTARFAVAVTSEIKEVEGTWADLAARADPWSPGQSFAFTGLWADALGIPARDRVFVTVAFDGAPVALLPLVRRRGFGARTLTWFPGSHVGCNAPIVDAARLAAMPCAERQGLWQAVAAKLGGADLLYLPSIPESPLFAELGASIPGDTLYRAEFSSWEIANTTQRNKSRRKHDRQQGERLEALGQVTFEEIDGGSERAAVLDIMFRQRAARFAAMGIADPFADAKVRGFYDSTLDPANGVPVKLHVLRLNGEVVAVRYNVVAGQRMFCLISSMSDDPRIQGGSPGKQCLLRVMQTVFDAGYSSFDMGAGLTDEKRHWCNVQMPLRQHYLPLTARGHAAALGHRLMQTTRRRIKSDARLLGLAKRVRAALNRGKGQVADEG